jgi:membrane fusion protein
MRVDPASPAQRGGNGGATLEAQLAVPEALLASTRVGAEVLLRYPAFPHQHSGQYRGRIVRIARQPIAATPSKAASSTVAYRVTVALERQRVRDDHGEERDLQPGLGVQAEVVVEKRRLYEWLFEPFARLRERFQA